MGQKSVNYCAMCTAKIYLQYINSLFVYIFWAKHLIEFKQIKQHLVINYNNVIANDIIYLGGDDDVL